ncbi:MAG: TRAP transporter small permease [Clostridium sp.]|nr:TRAP transporter small permease [Clostridium sp.]
MKILKRISGWIDGFFDCLFYLPVFMMVLLLLICSSSVLLRNILTSAFNWADEAMRFLLVYSTFIALPILVAKKKHISVDLTDVIFGTGTKGQKLFYIFSEALIFAGSAVLMPTCVTFMKMNLTGYSPAMQLPLYLVYSCMPIGFALTMAASANNIFKLIAGEG